MTSPLLKKASLFAIKLTMLWLIMVIVKTGNDINGAVLNHVNNGILIVLHLVPIPPMAVLFTLGKRIIFAILHEFPEAALSGKNVINGVPLQNALIKDLKKITF